MTTNLIEVEKQLQETQNYTIEVGHGELSYNIYFDKPEEDDDGIDELAEYPYQIWASYQEGDYIDVAKTLIEAISIIGKDLQEFDSAIGKAIVGLIPSKGEDK